MEQLPRRRREALWPQRCRGARAVGEPRRAHRRGRDLPYRSLPRQGASRAPPPLRLFLTHIRRTTPKFPATGPHVWPPIPVFSTLNSSQTQTLVTNLLAFRFANRELGRLFHADNVANVRIASPSRTPPFHPPPLFTVVHPPPPTHLACCRCGSPSRRRSACRAALGTSTSASSHRNSSPRSSSSHAVIACNDRSSRLARPLVLAGTASSVTSCRTT